ncbi:MAG: hypothetical protein ACE5PM_09020 [Candidatus Hydrothermarchaeales archaeon]
MKRGRYLYIGLILILIGAGCITGKAPTTSPSTTSPKPRPRKLITGDPARYVLSESDVPPGFHLDIAWYQDIEAAANTWDDPEEGREKLAERGYINAYISRLKKDISAIDIFSEPFFISSRVEIYEAPMGAAESFRYRPKYFIEEGGLKKLSSVNVGDEGVLLGYDFSVEDVDFSFYVLLFRYANTLNTVIVGGFAGSPNRGEIIEYATTMEWKLEKERP